MNYIKILLITVSIVFFNGCCSKNVYFNKQIYATKNNLVSQADNGIIRTYQDRLGYFYPDDVSRSSSGLEDISYGNEYWEKSQIKIETNLAKIINNNLDDPKSQKTLVILIHGFNVKSAEPTYSYVRDIINSFNKWENGITYWQVNWDGMSGGFFSQTNAWKVAQANGPLVGLRLRGVLNQVIEKNPDVKIRILTHSSGAFVAASLLGNNTNALSLAKNCSGYYQFFCLNIRETQSNKPYRVPQPKDLRLGLIAPATPFNSFAMLPTTPDSAYERGSYDGLLVKKMKLIVGTNSKDYAISKFILSSAFHGATSLGMGGQNCRNLLSGLGDMRLDPINQRNIDAECINFAFSSTYNESEYIFWESHDLSVYLQRDMMPKFLKSLFD